MTRSRKAALASLFLLPVLAGGFALQARATRGGAQLLDQVLIRFLGWREKIAGGR